MYFYPQDDELNAICQKSPRNVSGHGDTLSLPCIIAWPDIRQLCLMGSAKKRDGKRDTADLRLDVPPGDDTADQWADGKVSCVEFADWLLKNFSHRTHRALTEVVALLREPQGDEAPATVSGLREMSAGECLDVLMNEVQLLIRYCANNVMAPTAAEKLSLFMSSLFSLFDGESSLGHIHLVTRATEKDQQYDRDSNKNWWPNGADLSADAPLHEVWHSEGRGRDANNPIPPLLRRENSTRLGEWYMAKYGALVKNSFKGYTYDEGGDPNGEEQGAYGFEECGDNFLHPGIVAFLDNRSSDSREDAIDCLGDAVRKLIEFSDNLKKQISLIR